MPNHMRGSVRLCIAANGVLVLLVKMCMDKLAGA